MQCSHMILIRNKRGYVDYVPCGQCIACRLNYGKLWSIRMMEELKKHDKACFATLTYNDNSLPAGNKLLKSDLQRFFKRLRKRTRVRYFSCGEYGDTFGRPHYHAIIYGLSPNDVDIVQRAWSVRIRNKYRRHRYPDAFMDDDGKWYRPLGNVKLGTVTEDSCAYVAKYMTKKLRGHALEEKLKEDPDYQNEFVLMSRRPGIGADVGLDMQKFLSQNKCYYRKGIKSGLPRYWKEKFGIKDPIGIPSSYTMSEEDKQKRDFILTHDEDYDRLITKRLKFFKRKD